MLKTIGIAMVMLTAGAAVADDQAARRMQIRVVTFCQHSEEHVREKCVGSETKAIELMSAMLVVMNGQPEAFNLNSSELAQCMRLYELRRGSFWPAANCFAEEVFVVLGDDVFAGMGGD